MVSNIDVIDRMNDELDRILMPYVTQGPFALLDYPDHSNVGDAAIWLGTTAFFARKAVAPAYVSKADYLTTERLARMEVIFMHGGGNFGDVWTDFWPNCQAFREAVIERFPNKPIVQLPQTIHFSSQFSIDRMSRLIEAHRNFILLVRDLPSLELAQRNFQCVSILCPDMAFALGPLWRSRAATREVLFLLRTDKEKQTETVFPELPPGSDVADWLNEPRWTRPMSKLTTISIDGWRSVVGSGGTTEKLRQRYLDRLARARLGRGIDLLSNYKRVVSDRLHAHIISTLLGVPHVIMENSYGKNGALVEAFSTHWDGMSRAETPEQALTLLRQARYSCN